MYPSLKNGTQFVKEGVVSARMNRQAATVGLESDMELKEVLLRAPVPCTPYAGSTQSLALGAVFPRYFQRSAYRADGAESAYMDKSHFRTDNRCVRAA